MRMGKKERMKEEVPQGPPEACPPEAFYPLTEQRSMSLLFRLGGVKSPSLFRGQAITLVSLGVSA